MKTLKKIAVLLVAAFCLFVTACTGFIQPCEVCKDENNDHKCDKCKTKISAHIDEDDDHYCDICAGKTSSCRDGDNDHLCDVCAIAISVCIDANKDHECDTCGAHTSDCKDTDSNHYCDICDTRVSACVDALADEQCDICGVALIDINYEAITNEITTKYMHALVTVRSQYLETDGYWYGQTSSGVVYEYDQTNGIYYILTNNHALERYYEPSLTALQTKVVAVDSYGLEYEAAVVCRDAAYDLAVLAISKTNKSNFTVMELASVNPTVGQKVAALGNPLGQKNAITYGEVLGYKECGLRSDYSQVEFSCIKHTAWMTQGSSGGLLMSFNYKIVGINFAVTAHPTTGAHMSSWTVPVEKVKEFLEANEGAFIA